VEDEREEDGWDDAEPELEDGSDHLAPCLETLVPVTPQDPDSRKSTFLEHPKTQSDHGYPSHSLMSQEGKGTSRGSLGSFINATESANAAASTSQLSQGRMPEEGRGLLFHWQPRGMTLKLVPLQVKRMQGLQVAGPTRCWFSRRLVPTFRSLTPTLLAFQERPRPRRERSSEG